MLKYYEGCGNMPTRTHFMWAQSKTGACFKINVKYASAHCAVPAVITSRGAQLLLLNMLFKYNTARLGFCFLRWPTVNGKEKEKHFFYRRSKEEKRSPHPEERMESLNLDRNRCRNSHFH
uniref:Uncharacterized protein n=1 Tax=Anguilla anguilla TaxID=7936 RepID=A0A0E9X1J9_ANGAN